MQLLQYYSVSKLFNRIFWNIFIHILMLQTILAIFSTWSPERSISVIERQTDCWHNFHLFFCDRQMTDLYKIFCDHWFLNGWSLYSLLWTLSILLCLGLHSLLLLLRFKFLIRSLPICTTSFTAFSTANAGVSRIRGSNGD